MHVDQLEELPPSRIIELTRHRFEAGHIRSAALVYMYLPRGQRGLGDHSSARRQIDTSDDAKTSPRNRAHLYRTARLNEALRRGSGTRRKPWPGISLRACLAEAAGVMIPY